MDFRLFVLLNGAMRGHGHLDTLAADFATWSVPAFALATVALWFLARPGGSPRWKLACVSGLASAGVGLLAAQAIGRAWPRERPFAAHPTATVLLTHRSRDPSFPSDHATAAFAVAFAVLAFSLRAGILFLCAASLIGASRVLVGLHYPGDVAGGALLGVAAALVVVLGARAPVARAVSLLGRASDPFVTRLRR